MPNALASAVADRSTAVELDNLDAYRVSLEFQRLAAAILSGTHGELRSHLDRADVDQTQPAVSTQPGRRLATGTPATAHPSTANLDTSPLRLVCWRGLVRLFVDDAAVEEVDRAIRGAREARIVRDHTDRGAAAVQVAEQLHSWRFPPPRPAVALWRAFIRDLGPRGTMTVTGAIETSQPPQDGKRLVGPQRDHGVDL